MEQFLKTTLEEPALSDEVCKRLLWCKTLTGQVVEVCDTAVDEILELLEGLSACGEKLFSLVLRLSFFYGTCERAFLILAVNAFESPSKYLTNRLEMRSFGAEIG